MREILFRGKNEADVWHYGAYLPYESGEVAILESFSKYGYEAVELSRRCKVIPETVGQFTGLTDKNGKKIFEGDIVKSCEYDDVYFVKYFDNENYPAFDCVPDVPLCECNGLSFLANTEGCEIIGNIHDNKELLDVK